MKKRKGRKQVSYERPQNMQRDKRSDSGVGTEHRDSKKHMKRRDGIEA